MRIPLAYQEKEKGRASRWDSATGTFRCIYNDVEFPTVPAFGHTLAVAAVEIATLAGAGPERSRRAPAPQNLPRVSVETPAPPGFRKKPLERNAREHVPACVSLPSD
jgi:hypothetical protein